MSPLQRSKKLLEEQGYLVAKVEHWNAFAKIRQDLFGLFDLLAVKGKETVGVQVTSMSGKQPHVQKMLASKLLPVVRKAWRVQLHSWRKLKATGWTVDIKEFGEVDIPDVLL